MKAYSTLKEKGCRDETTPFNSSFEKQQCNEEKNTITKNLCQDINTKTSYLYLVFNHDVALNGPATPEKIEQSKTLLLEREQSFHPQPQAKLETKTATYYRYTLTNTLASSDLDRWNDFRNRPCVHCKKFKADEYLHVEAPDVDGEWMSLGGEPQPLEEFLPDDKKGKPVIGDAEKGPNQILNFSRMSPVVSDERPAPKDVLEAVERLIEGGFSVVAVQPGSKTVSKKGVPNNKAWNEFAYQPSHFALSSNISIRLGRCHGNVVDIDCDSTSTWRASKLLFPEGARYGRRSGKTGHILIRSEDIPADDSKLDYTFKKKAAEDLVGIANERILKGGILEARASAGMHSVVPPSIYIEGKDKVEDQIEWIDGLPKGVDGLPKLSWHEIEKRCQLLTLLTVADATYPESGRNNFCFALAGVLARLGLEPNMIDHIIVGLARMNNDEEADKRSMGERTVAALEDGEHVKGLPAFAEEAGLSDAIVKDLRKWLSLEGLNSNSIPDNAIILSNADLPKFIDETVTILNSENPEYFVRGTGLYKASQVVGCERTTITDGRYKDMVPSNDGTLRQLGNTVLLPARTSTIRVDAMRRARYGMINSEGQFVPTIPKLEFLEPVKSCAIDLRFPVLRAITKSPIFGAGGKIHATAGYDPKTQLYGDFDPSDFREVAENPSIEEISKAKATLEKPLTEYKFESRNVSDNDQNNVTTDSAFSTAKSVMLAAMLTSVCRANLRTAPGFIFDAVVAGSGKSKLAAICGIMATGSKPAVTTQGPNEEEDEKRLGAILLSGDPVILVDNITRPISGDFLCSLMVEETVSPRILGKSEKPKIPVTALVTFTGNNVSVRGDMSRRLLVCRVNPGVENPEKKVYPFDPVKKALEMRSELVWAALTIMRGYAAHLEAGGKRVEVGEAMGSFEDWSLRVREALIFAGCADPVETRDAIVAGDTEKDEFIQLLELWEQAIGNREVTTKDLRCLPDDRDEKHPNRYIAEDLVEHLVTMTNRPKFNSRSVGRLLARYRDRIVGGRKLISIQVGKHAAKWRLVSTDNSLIAGPEVIEEPF